MIVNMKDNCKTVDLDDIDALGHEEELAMLAEALPALELAFVAHTMGAQPSARIVPDLSDDIYG
jgi:hypothetical protein